VPLTGKSADAHFAEDDCMTWLLASIEVMIWLCRGEVLLLMNGKTQKMTVGSETLVTVSLCRGSP
jgi:hypothetical protein